MENPEALAGARIETTDVAFYVVFAFGNAARLVRRAHDDGVAGDDRRRMESDVGIHQIDSLIVIQLQIDGAVFAEAPHRKTGLRIECNQPVSRCDVEDSLV